jgi:hypothetical protein
MIAQFVTLLGCVAFSSTVSVKFLLQRMVAVLYLRIH